MASLRTFVYLTANQLINHHSCLFSDSQHASSMPKADTTGFSSISWRLLGKIWGRSGEELRSLLLIFLYLFVLFSLSLAREPGCRRQPQLGRSGTEWTADSAPIPWDMARTARTEALEGFFSPLSGRKKTMIGQQPASRACWTMLNFPYLKDKPDIKSYRFQSHSDPIPQAAWTITICLRTDAEGRLVASSYW